MPTDRSEYQYAYQRSEIAKASRKRRQRELRTQVFDLYGHRCACCGEDRYEFLTLDHPNGGGNQERRALLKSGGRANNDKFLRMIRKSGVPDPEFRILCHNCNQAIGFYGRCPHSGKE